MNDPLQYMLHRLNPDIWRISGNIAVRWYGLAYVAGFAAGFFILRHLALKGRLRLTLHQVEDLMINLLIGVVIGARLGYVVFYEPSLLVSFSPAFPFWGLLEINRGGMSSHGGFLGVTVAVILFARRAHLSWRNMGDAIVLAAPAGLFFGRAANFINGELYGRPADVPWAMCFPTEIFTWPSGKIAPLLAALAAKGHIFTDLEHLIRVIRVNDDAARIIHGFLTPRHPSQIYEALLEGIALFLILWVLHPRLKNDGQLTAIFFWSYAVLRIIAEQFREPDAAIGYQWLGLTRGQWLSMLFLIVGIIFWYVSQPPAHPASAGKNTSIHPKRGGRHGSRNSQTPSG